MGSAVIIGSSGGIGCALVEALVAAGDHAPVFAFSRRAEAVAGTVAGAADLLDEASLAAAAARVATAGPVDLVIVAAGILHGEGVAPEKSWAALHAAQMTRVLQINMIGPALVAKHFLPLFTKAAPGRFAALSARVGSVSDNRLGGWYSYRASKAALNMLIRNLAIELSRRSPGSLCVGLHPGTVATPLSAPFQRGVPPEQLFSTEQSAAHLLTVLHTLTPAQTGRCFAWNGEEIAP